MYIQCNSIQSPKKKRILTHATTWMKLEYVIRNVVKANHKRQTLYDSTYMRSLEDLNLERQKAEWWLPGAEGIGSYCLMGRVSV